MATDEDFSFVYPPKNVPADTIGPVHLYDTIELSWTPRTLRIAPPYKLQMTCLLANNSYVYEPITNVSTPHPWFVKENYDTQPYGCWWAFTVPQGGKGDTGAAFNVIPTTAATAITFRPSAMSSSTPSSTSSLQTTTTTPAATSQTTAVVPSDAGLSIGAKAGIGFGAAGGLILLIALVFGILFFRKRHEQRRGLQELPGYEIPKLHYDKSSDTFVEAAEPNPAVEAADTGTVRHEMQG